MFRIWHVVNSSKDIFYADVNDVEEGKRLLIALIEFDKFIVSKNNKGIESCRTVRKQLALMHGIKLHVLYRYEREYLKGFTKIQFNNQGIETFINDDWEDVGRDSSTNFLDDWDDITAVETPRALKQDIPKSERPKKRSGAYIIDFFTKGIRAI